MCVHRANFSYPDIHKTIKITVIILKTQNCRDVLQDKIQKCCLQFLSMRQGGLDPLVTLFVKHIKKLI